MEFETFRQEVQQVLDLPYKFVQTGYIYGAAAYRNNLGVAWEYDCLTKLYSFYKVEGSGLDKVAVKGEGTSLKEAFANKVVIPRVSY